MKLVGELLPSAGVAVFSDCPYGPYTGKSVENPFVGDTASRKVGTGTSGRGCGNMGWRFNTDTGVRLQLDERQRRIRDTAHPVPT